jgi:acyl-CoA reductase-like NAD-dependent aldehyde dehydrogenase
MVQHLMKSAPTSHRLVSRHRLATVARADEALLGDAVAAARRAFPAWAAAPSSDRISMMHKLVDALEARNEQIARLIVWEQGKT